MTNITYGDTMSSRRATVERIVSELLDIAGVADRLDLKESTVRTDTVRRDDFPEPITKFGRSSVWWVEDVDTWERDHRRSVGRPPRT